MEWICGRKKFFIIGIEVVIFVLYALFSVLTFQEIEIVYTDEDMLLRDVNGNFTEGGYLDTSYNGMEAAVTPVFQTAKGIYNIEVHYAAQGVIKAGLIYDAPGGMELVDDYEFKIDPTEGKLSYRAGIPGDSAVRFKIRLTGDAKEGDYVQLLQVHIASSRMTYLHNLFCIAAFFILLDIFFLFYRLYYKKQKPEQKVIFLILAAAAFLLGIPLYQNGLYNDSDLGFHLYRIEGLCQGLLSGRFPVRIQPGWLDGNGYAASVFYGDIFLYFPALLRMAGFALQDAYKFYIVMVNAATVFVSYYAFYKMSHNNRSAAMASILYSGSIYRLSMVYVATVGGYSAMVFLPLILAGFYLLFTEEVENGAYKRIWILLTVGFSGLLMTHMISCLMAGAYSVLACFILIKKVLRKETFLELVKAVAASVLVNLWFLVPFIQYMVCEKVRINSDLNQAIGNENYRVLLSRYIEGGKSFSGLFLNKNSIGYALIAVLLVYIITVPVQKKNSLTKNSRGIFGFMLVSVWVCMDFFPVIGLARISNVFVKYFNTIQDQGRFTACAVVFLSGLGALFFAMDMWDKRTFPLAAGLLGLIMLHQDLDYFKTVEPVVFYSDYAEEISGGVVAGEYIPIVTNPERLTREIETTEALQINDMKRSYLTFDISVTSRAQEEQQILLPVLYYSGYKAYDIESKTELKTFQGDNGRVAVAVPAGYNGTFHMAYYEPWYWRVSEWISFAALLFILYYIFSRKEFRNVWKLKKLQIPHSADTVE